jgi:hypothetical protein
MSCLNKVGKDVTGKSDNCKCFLVKELHEDTNNIKDKSISAIWELLETRDHVLITNERIPLELSKLAIPPVSIEFA